MNYYLPSWLLRCPNIGFSVIAEETRDISNRKQLDICIGWVSEMCEINEDAIGLVQLDSTTTEPIYTAI